jgi:hypothetical protein
MSAIFVSYSRKDVAAVEELVAHLEEAGHDVWRDREVVGGQDWWRTIISEIRTSDIFLVALSPALLDSAACSAELSYASALHKQVLPVRVAEGFSPAMLNSVLARTQMVDYYPPSVGTAIRLMRAIADLPAPNPIPTPEPTPPPAPLSYLSALRDRLEVTNPLTEPEQAQLVLTLRQSCRNVEEVTDARMLLKSMRSRPELYARIADEIDETLRITEPRVMPVSPSPSPSPPPPPVRTTSPLPFAPTSKPRSRAGVIGFGVAGLLAVGGIGAAVALNNNKADTNRNVPITQPDAGGQDAGWADGASGLCDSQSQLLQQIFNSGSATTFAEIADALTNLAAAIDQLSGAPAAAVGATDTMRTASSAYLNAQDNVNAGLIDEAAAQEQFALATLGAALTTLGQAGATKCSP